MDAHSHWVCFESLNDEQDDKIMADLCEIRLRGIDQAKVVATKAAMSQQSCDDDKEHGGTLLLALVAYIVFFVFF